MSDDSDFPKTYRYFTRDGRNVDIDTASAEDLRECVRYLFAELESTRRMHVNTLDVFEAFRNARP